VSAGLPWHDVAVIVATLAALLVAQFAAVMWSRYGARSTADVHRQARSERIVEQQEAAAERDVAQRGEAERAAAGRDGGEG
jgi:Flp pilus assembly protein TadB